MKKLLFTTVSVLFLFLALFIPTIQADNVLIVSKTCDKNIVSKVSEALLALKGDNSPEAKAVREQMGIKGYIKTTNKDFRHTLELLKKAGVDESFDFTFALR